MSARSRLLSVGSDALGRIPVLRLQQYAPVWLLWLGLILLALTLARLTWQLAGHWLPPVTESTLPSEAAPTPQQSQPSLGALIAARHLFGISMATAPNATTLPASHSSLVLKGVFADGAGRGAAIIADGTQQTYCVIGDTVGGAVLRKVFRDHVVLERGGRFETLALPTHELPPAPPALGEMASAGAMPAGVNSAETGRLLQQYQTSLRNEPQALIGLLSTTPVMEAGKHVGVRIGAGQDPLLLGKFGLQAGDVVTSLNGTALDGQRSGMDVLKGLANAPSLSVTLLRGGQPMTMQYQVKNDQ